MSAAARELLEDGRELFEVTIAIKVLMYGKPKTLGSVTSDPIPVTAAGDAAFAAVGVTSVLCDGYDGGMGKVTEAGHDVMGWEGDVTDLRPVTIGESLSVNHLEHRIDA